MMAAPWLLNIDGTGEPCEKKKKEKNPADAIKHTPIIIATTLRWGGGSNQNHRQFSGLGWNWRSAFVFFQKKKGSWTDPIKRSNTCRFTRQIKKAQIKNIKTNKIKFSNHASAAPASHRPPLWIAIRPSWIWIGFKFQHLPKLLPPFFFFFWKFAYPVAISMMKKRRIPESFFIFWMCVWIFWWFV